MERGDTYELGAARMVVDLEDGKITVYHGGDDSLLLEVDDVAVGTWDALWSLLENCGTVKFRAKG